MRNMVIGILVIVLAVQGVLLMLFSATGNDMLLPQVNAYLKEDIKKYKVEVSRFRLGLYTLSFVAKINDSIDLKAQGKVNLFSQTFDLDYVLEADEIKTKMISIKEDIHIKGKAIGNAEDMKIKGKGLAFESQMNFDLRKVVDTLQDIKINMKKAEISKILAVLNHDNYADGLLTVEVDLPHFDPKNPQGSAKIFIQNMRFDEEKVLKDFDFSMPPKTLLTADLLASAKEDIISFEGTVQSNMANVNFVKGTYDPQTKDFSSSYHLDVQDLAKFNMLAKRDLRGELDMEGVVSKKGESITVTGNTKSFSGKSNIVYKDNTLDWTFDNINTKTLLYKLGEEDYISGTTTGDIHLSNLKNAVGNFDIAVKGNVNTKAFKEKTKTDLGKTFYLNAKLQGKMKDEKIFSHITLKTTMADIKADKFVYDLKTKSIRTDYRMDISDMSKLQPLTDKVLKGNMSLKGEITKQKDLLITGAGKEFDGNINFKLLNDDLHTDLSGVTVSKVMYMLGYPQVIEAVAEVKADYNIKKRKGEVHGTLNNAKMLPTQLSTVLEQFAHMKLTQQRFNNSKFVAKIDRDIIKFTLDATNKRNYIRVTNGVVDKGSDALSAEIDIEMEGKDMAATIGGTVANPNVMLNSSVYLEKKINKNLDTLIDKNVKGESAEQLKSLIKGFF
jgi:hypothetical protein